MAGAGSDLAVISQLVLRLLHFLFVLLILSTFAKFDPAVRLFDPLVMRSP